MQINIKERVDVNQDGPSLIIEASPPPQAPKQPKMFSTYEKLIISRGAEGPGREILQRPPSVCLSVCPSRLVFAL